MGSFFLMCSWFPAPRYVTGVSLFFALTLQFPNSFPASLNFLGLCFPNCVSYDFNSDDLLCIFFFIPRFQYMPKSYTVELLL